MYRTVLFLIIQFILAVMLLGCSSSGDSPVNPITPGSQGVWNSARETAGSNTGTNVTDKFWHTTIQMNGETWIASLNPNGTVYRATGRGVEESSNPFEVIGNHPEIFRLDTDNFRAEFDEVHGGIRYVIMRQTYENLWVWPSRVDMRYGRGGKLMAVGAKIYPDINVNTTPTYPLNSAKQIVESEIDSDEPFERSELVVFVSGDTAYYLAWMIEYGNWIHWIDAHNGSVLDREHHMWDAYTGNINTTASQPDPLAPEVPFTMNNLELRMSWDSGDSYPYYAMPITDIDGDYNYIDGTYSELYSEVRFYGPYANSNNRNNFPNNEAVQNRVTYDGTPEDWYFDNAESVRSERTGWVWTNATHDFLKSIEPSYNLLDWVVQVNVNDYPMCNAYANENSINFFRPSDGCLDTGHVPDIICHEYGHINTFEQFGNDQPDLMIHEGYSDTIANLMIEDHYIGYNIQGEGTYFRDSKNNYKWPFPECNGEGHCLGQLLAGAHWDMYEYLGKDYVGYLYHFSRYGRPQTFVECAFEVLLVDDDDDDWTNGTPNYDIIYECFNTNHNIEVPYIEPPTGIQLTLVPSVPDIHVGQYGGIFNYDLTIENLDDTPRSFHIWAEVKFGGGGTYGPIIPPGYLYHSPYYLTWQPEQVFSIPLEQIVPGGLLPDTFEYHIKAGEYGGELDDDKWFDVTIDP
ncbi:hypothetical protein J7L05_05725 [bacterium]|nr:hypothetical protein [bacterium]